MDWDSVDENDGGPTYMSLAASSYHPGGVNALFADGSVHFVKNSVSPVDLVVPGHHRRRRSHQRRPVLSPPTRSWRVVPQTDGTSKPQRASRAASSWTNQPEPLHVIGCSRKRLVACHGFKSRDTRTLCSRLPALAAVKRAHGTLPELIPVKGRVTLKGQPSDQGHRPVRTRRFRPSGYRQDQSDGTFVLSTTRKLTASSPATSRLHHRPRQESTGDRSLQKILGNTSAELEAE